MAKKSKSFGYIHDLLHFDYGYTDDEIDEIIENELFYIKTLLRQIELKFSDILELFLIVYLNLV